MIKDNKGLDRTRIGSLQGFSSIHSNDFSKFLLEKSERLASALYIITGYIPDGDPTRDRLRSAALEVIGHSSTPHDFSEVTAERMAGRCVEIAAILETAQYAGLVSPMNARIICDEYAFLAEYAKKHQSLIARRGSEIYKDGLYPPKDNVLYKGQSYKKDRQSSTSRSLSTNVKNVSTDERTERIFRLLRKKGLISIKDAESELSDLGSKTVQRLILGLVSRGQLEKIGDRRWSTYRFPPSSPVPTGVQAIESVQSIDNSESIA